MTEISNITKVYKNCYFCDLETQQTQQAQEETVADCGCGNGSDCTCGDICNCEDDCNCDSTTHNHSIEISEHSHLPSFLKITNKFDYSKLEGLVYAEKDVYSGDVQTETEKLQNEQNLINRVIAENTAASTDISSIFTAKKINFEKYENKAVSSTGQPLKTTTNTNNLMRNIQYSVNYGTSAQKNIIEGAVNKLVNWLDNCIQNYESVVQEGKNRGDSEVKLSFLLKLRKAIENCNFPVGFGNDEYFRENSDENTVVLGAYSNSFYDGMYLNPTDNANDNNAAIQHLDRSIILNADVFMINRKYTTEAQLISAINSGKFDYINDETLDADAQQAALNQAFGEIIMASDDVYYNFAEVYLASILAHEFIHSTHIGNEAVTYNTCELIEDDFRNTIVFDNWRADTQAAVDSILSGLTLNELTYGEAFLPTQDGGGIGFHDLLPYDKTSATKENVVEHGHEENMAYTNVYDDDGNLLYRGYADFGSGNTLEDDRKELMNFVV